MTAQKLFCGSIWKVAKRDVHTVLKLTEKESKSLAYLNDTVLATSNQPFEALNCLRKYVTI